MFFVLYMELILRFQEKSKLRTSVDEFEIPTPTLLRISESTVGMLKALLDFTGTQGMFLIRKYRNKF